MNFLLQYSWKLALSLILALCVTLAAADTDDSAEFDQSSSSLESGVSNERLDDEGPTKMAKTDNSLPNLVSGKLGEHPDDDTGVKRVWPHRLPFLAQGAIDAGFDLPNAYGVGAVYAYVDQLINLDNLRIGFGDEPGNTSVPFVTFEDSYTKANAVNFKVDAWIFPFLNVFLLGGYMDGEGLIPIVIPGDEALKVLLPAVGARCDAPPGSFLRPDLCDEDLIIRDRPDYSGETVGGGIILPMGWRNYFVVVPVSYTYTKTSDSDTSVKAFQASLRGGYHFQTSGGTLAFYGGATYLKVDQDIAGTYVLETGDPLLGDIDINYTIHQNNKDKVNYMLGFNWMMTKNWWLQAEVGFGGSRDNVIGSVSYRW